MDSEILSTIIWILLAVGIVLSCIAGCAKLRQSIQDQAAEQFSPRRVSQRYLAATTISDTSTEDVTLHRFPRGFVEDLDSRPVREFVLLLNEQQNAQKLNVLGVPAYLRSASSSF